MEKYASAYESGTEFLADFCEPDLLLLDVEMDGLAVKNVLREKKTFPRTLFVSRHPEAMDEAYDRNVYGFLKKPPEYEKFAEKMHRVMWDVNEERKTVLLSGEKEEKIICATDILYVKAQGKYVRLYLDGEESPLFDERGIGKWCELLDKGAFALSYRGYLLNLDKVEHVKEKALLENGWSVPVSRRFRKEFEENDKKRWLAAAGLLFALLACTVFANLVSNAREACERVKNHKKEICLQIKQNKGHLVIVIENPVEWEVDVEHLEGATTKENDKEHGYGLQNVREIVLKYQGETLRGGSVDLMMPRSI